MTSKCENLIKIVFLCLKFYRRISDAPFAWMRAAKTATRRGTKNKITFTRLHSTQIMKNENNEQSLKNRQGKMKSTSDLVRTKYKKNDPEEMLILQMLGGNVINTWDFENKE